eukprot:337437-Pleurochrysis_carterae.AAC.1
MVVGQRESRSKTDFSKSINFGGTPKLASCTPCKAFGIPSGTWMRTIRYKTTRGAGGRFKR